jgi:hypothetical protein
MAHIEKIKNTKAIGRLKHYERSEKNPHKDIIQERTHLNYRLFAPRKDPQTGQEISDIDWFRKRKKECKPLIRRSDVNSLASLCIKIPQDVQAADEQRFMVEVLKFMAKRVGSENIISGFCHKDERGINEKTGENAPHAHITWLPVVKEKKKNPETGKLEETGRDKIYAKSLDLNFFLNFHKELQAYFDLLPEPIQGAKVNTGYMKNNNLKNRPVPQMKKERKERAVFKLDRAEVERKVEQKGVFINR